jgi:hypothetical protein
MRIDEYVFINGLSGSTLSVLRGISPFKARVETASGLRAMTSCSGLRRVEGSEINSLNKNLDKHNVENWECEQIFFNEPLIILGDPKHSFLEKL